VATEPSTTTTASLTTGEPVDTSSVVAPGPWVDATGNLAGLTSECGTISLVAGDLAGVAKNGLWNGATGDQWQRLGTGAGSATIDNRATSIVHDPSKPQTFWESGAYGAGVFRTDDGGSTFRRLGNVESADIVSVDFTDPARATLVVGLHEQPRVLRSKDGGQTWQDISAGLPADVGYAASPHVIDANTYLLGTRNGASSAVLRTADGGATWKVVHQGGVTGPVLNSAADSKLYWLLDDGHGVISSADGGQTWQETDSSGPVGGPSGALVELPDGRVATLGTVQVLISGDHGATWESIGPALPYAPSGMTYSPSKKAFYIWHFDCEPGSIPVQPRSIMRLDAQL
jgi:photosystem II stability/assembly factor-like uncharacterized protein